MSSSSLSSIPDLRKRSPMFYLIIFGALALLIAGGVAAVVALDSPKDPGIAACDHVEQQAEMNAEKWDEYVDALVAAVQERIRSAPPENEPIRIRADRRDDRCRETLRKLKKAMQPATYDALAACIADATNPRQGAKCLALVR